MSSFKSATCGACGHAIRYLESQAGETIRCPKCRAIVQLGGATTAAPRAPAVGGGAAPGPKQPAWLKDVERIAGGTAGAPNAAGDRPMGLPGTTRIPGGGWGAGKVGAPMPPPPVLPVRPSGGMGVIITSCVVAVLALGGALAYVMIPARPSESKPDQKPSEALAHPSAAGGVAASSASSKEPGGPPEGSKPSPESEKPANPERRSADVPPEVESSQQPEAPQGRPLDSSRPHADQVQAEAGFERTIYASSLLGMRDFDAKYLTITTRDECRDLMIKDFGDLDGDGKYSDDLEWVRITEIFNATRRVEGGEKCLYDTRPLCVVRFKGEGLPEGVRVTVFAEVPPDAAKFMQVKPDLPVSCAENVPLATEGPDVKKECCDFNREDDCFEVPVDLRWNEDELRKLKQPFTFTLTLRVRYQDGSHDTVSGPITLRPPAEVEYRYPLQLSVGVMVDEGHPWVHRIINALNQDPDNKRRGITLVGAGGDEVGAMMSMFQVWKYLSVCGFRYQVLNAADGDAQRIRPVHESLSDRNGCCIDGTVLLASFARAFSLDCTLIWRPGHIYIAYGSKRERDLMLDTTLINPTSLSFRKLPPPERFATLPDWELQLFGEFLNRFPFLKSDPTFATFCWGHIVAQNDFQEHWKAREAVVAEVAALRKSDDKRSGEDQNKLRDLTAKLANQLKWFNMSELRRLGVKPLGSPKSLSTDYRFPRP